MRMRNAFLVAAMLLAACAVPASAQTSTQRIIGLIVDRETLAPIQGAFIQLVDSTGVVRTAGLSDTSGRFILEVPVPGRYTLKAERIGYANSVSDTLVVAAGKTLPYRFDVTVRAITLEGLKVTTKGRCRISRDLGKATATLWEEARKALEVVVWAERKGGVPYQDMLWTRTRDLVSLELEDGRRILSSGFGQKPFWSATGQDLAKHGFVRSKGDSVTYFGPDAQALLSDAFLAGHCFRAVEPHHGEKGLVGLAFEPLDRHGPPDITGTLWLDRKTSELRYAEFEYTRHLVPLDGVSKKLFGGRVDFERLNDGAWVVRKWWLRMPSWGNPFPPPLTGALPVASVDLRARQNGLRIREQGGEIAFVPRLAPSAHERTAAVDGTLYDSVDARPLAGATVFLADAYTTATTTDMLGRFHLRDLPAGRHVIAFFAAFTDSLDLPVVTRPVFLEANRRTRVDLTIPRAAGCHPTFQSTAIVGFVEGATDGRRLAAVPVRAAWRTPSTLGKDMWVERADTTVTDARGRYLFCGVPLNSPVDLGPAEGATMKLYMDLPRIIRQDLLTKASAGAPAKGSEPR